MSFLTTAYFPLMLSILKNFTLLASRYYHIFTNQVAQDVAYPALVTSEDGDSVDTLSPCSMSLHLHFKGFSPLSICNFP